VPPFSWNKCLPRGKRSQRNGAGEIERVMHGRLEKLQKTLLQNTLIVLFVPASLAFGSIAYQLNSPADLHRLLYIYSPLMTLFTLAVFLGRTPYYLRVGLIVFIATAAGISELYYFGIASMGFMFLSLAVLMTTVFSGLRLGILVLALLLLVSPAASPMPTPMGT
jgi:hypothetical protein